MYDALLDPVAQVAARQRRGRIAEAVRAVRRRLVVGPEYLLLERQPIHERLAAVIQGVIARPIRLGERVDLDHHTPIPVEVAVAFVAELVVVDREFAKAVAAGRAHDRVPTARLWPSGARVEIARARRFDNQRAEQPVAGLFAVVAVAVEIVGAFGLVLVHHPLVLDRLARVSGRGAVGGVSCESASWSSATTSIVPNMRSVWTRHM